MKLNNPTSLTSLLKVDTELFCDALFNQQIACVVILSPEGRILALNDLALTSQGGKREAFIGEFFWKSPAWANNPEWEAIWKKRLDEALIYKKPITAKDFFQLEDGSIRYVDDSISAIFNPDTNELAGYITFAIDTTQYKINDKQTLENDARLQYLLAHSQIGHWEVNLTDNSSHRSLQHDKIFGYDSLLSEWSYEIFLEHVLVDEREGVDKKFQQAKKDNTDWNFECQIRRKDGVIRWILASGGHIVELDGQAKVIAGVVQDITDIKKASLQKLKHDAEMHSLLTALPDTYFRLMLDGTIVDYFSQNDADLLATPEAFLGKRVQDILPSEVANLFLLKVVELQKVNHTIDFQYALTIKNQLLHFEARLNKIPDSAQIICVVRNVTDEFNSKQRLAVREQFFRSIFEQSAVGVALVDAETGKFIRINQRYCDIIGYNMQEMTNGKTFQELTHPEDLQSDSAYFEKVRCGLQNKLTREKRYIHKKGHSVWVEISASPSGRIGEQSSTLVAIVLDINDRKKSEEKLLLSSRVISNTHDGFIITDAEHVVVDVNPAFTNITGYNSEDVVGKTLNVLLSDRHNQRFYEKMWETAEQQQSWQGELWCVSKKGHSYAILLTISTLKNDQNDITHYVSVFSDITNNKHQQEQLNLMAHYDVLTKLPNRALFIDRFHQSIAHSKRTGLQLAVCFFDLDDFKPVNDKFGHDVGDRLLIEVASRITACIRKEDTVSRQGGDEFALLLNDIKSKSQYEATLKRIHDSLAEPYIIDDIEHLVTASSGVTLYPSDDGDIDTLLRHADHAMYQSKLAGKQRSQLYSLDLDRDIINKNNQLEEIKQALANEEFELYYQPKVNMASGEVWGAEALIRWNHPHKGLVPPLDFLPLTNGTSLEVGIGEWVMKQALRQLEIWHKQGIQLELSINISSNHLLSHSFVNHLEKLLQGYTANHAPNLQLEVLESSAFGDMNALNHIVEICQNQLGVGFALDDFGTGYSSLTHLRRLSVNTIKIDQGFVRDMLDDPNDYTIIEGVIMLTKLFRRSVIAEGVETEAHGLMLLLMGCHQAQGYQIAKPMCETDFFIWLYNYSPNQAWLRCANKRRNNKENRLDIFRMLNEKWIEKFKLKLASLPQENKPWPIIEAQLCQCGNWLDREKQEQLFKLEDLKKLEQAHDHLHMMAYQITDKYQQGDIESARADLWELEMIADEMHQKEKTLRPLL